MTGEKILGTPDTDTQEALLNATGKRARLILKLIEGDHSREELGNLWGEDNTKQEVYQMLWRVRCNLPPNIRMIYEDEKFGLRSVNGLITKEESEKILNRFETLDKMSVLFAKQGTIKKKTLMEKLWNGCCADRTLDTSLSRFKRRLPLNLRVKANVDEICIFRETVQD